MKCLYVQPIGGLCNRMRVIVGAASLANKLNRRLVVIWTQDSTLNARFDELFESIPYKVIETKLASLYQRLIWHYLVDIRKYKVLNDAWIASEARGKDYNLWKSKIENVNILINTNLDILFDGDYSIFRVKKNLLMNMNNVVTNNNTIGVHIRRTDNVNALKYSPTDLFVEKIKEELYQNSDICIYLATDDPNEEKKFISEFGNKIIIYKKHSLDRNNPIAIKDAVLDLYNLSHCRKIYGSYYSSFSDTAALWTGIEKIELKKK